MVLKEPLSPDAATALIHAIARSGDVGWGDHAIKALAARKLQTPDCVNVLRCGSVADHADLEHGTWRYRIQTNRICVVVAFRSDTELSVVTAWRVKG